IGHYVKILLDQVFGIANFRSDIARIKCNPKNFERKGYGNVKDMILFYTKTARFVWNEPREEMGEESIKRLFPRLDAEGRRYTTTPLHAPGETRNGPTGRPWRGRMPPTGRHWRVAPEELSRLEEHQLIEWSRTGNPRKRIFADEKAARGKRVQDVWEFKDPPYPDYPTQKNIEVIKRIISTSSNPGDLVLDCFAGSGTTLVAAQELGRRWIGIDNSSHAINVARERLQSLAGGVEFLEHTGSGEDGSPPSGR
ncbi:MAG: site-specific DNA-methyltransferase, partial [Bacteroidota bacterium]